MTAPTSSTVLAFPPKAGTKTASSQEKIWELLTDLNRSGITVLMVTHEADMAAFARTIVHFKDGLVERVKKLEPEFTEARKEREAARARVSTPVGRRRS